MILLAKPRSSEALLVAAGLDGAVLHVHSVAHAGGARGVVIVCAAMHARLREAAAALVLAAILRDGCLGHAFATAPLAHTRPAALMLTQPRKVETTRLRLCARVSEVVAQSLF